MLPLAERPQEVPFVFAERFNSGDLDAVAEVYDDGAILVLEPDSPMSGADAHGANAHLIGLGVPITVNTRHCYTTGDLALLVVDWVIAGNDRDGNAVHIEGTATDVARRGPDGRWRYAIDNPFGTATRT